MAFYNVLVRQGSSYRSFSLSRNKKKIKNYPVQKATKFSCYRRYRNKTIIQVLGLCVSPNFRYSSKCFAEIYRSQYENAILVYFCGTPIWRPENRVNIWNLLWLSRRLIISTEKTSIYISTFANALSSKRVRNHEISIFFQQTRSYPCVTHLHNPEIQNALVSKRSKLLNCKIINRYKYTASYA